MRAPFTICTATIGALLLSGLAGAASAQQIDPSSDLGKFRDYRDTGMKALDHSDPTAAMANFIKAEELIPDSPSILILKAQTAQKQGRLKNAYSFVKQYLNRGYVMDLKANPDFHQFWDETFDERQGENMASQGELTTVSSSPDFAITEGLTYDADAEKFYVSGVRTGTVTALSTKGAKDIITFRAGVAAYGLGLHDGKLWATTAATRETKGFDPKSTIPSKIVALDPKTGAVVTTISDPDKTRRFGHILAGKDDLYVTDSEHGEVLRLNGYAGTLQSLVPEGYMDSPDALAENSDASVLVVADFISGLYRVDLATGAMQHLTPPQDGSFLGISYLVRYGNDLIGIQTGFKPNRVVKFHMSSDWSQVESEEVLARSATDLVQPTQGVIVNDAFVFVAKSQWDNLDSRGNPIKAQPDNAVIASLHLAP